MKAIIFSHQRQNFTQEEFNSDMFEIKRPLNAKILCKALASVARNLIWALPILKGTLNERECSACYNTTT